jgi:acyl-CoA thioesterase
MRDSAAWKKGVGDMSELELAQRCADRMYAADRASRELGIEIRVIAPGTASAEMTIDARMLNGFGICHGGYIFTLADSAFAFACNAYDNVTVAAGASIEFLQPAREGERLSAVATERYRAGRRGIYEVVVRNALGQDVALFRGRAHATAKPLLMTESDT